jgi:hypothetical protein
VDANDLSNDIPDHPYFQEYRPDFQLHITPSKFLLRYGLQKLINFCSFPSLDKRIDLNTDDYLEGITKEILSDLENLSIKSKGET